MAKKSVDSLPKEKPTIRLDENDCPDIKNWKIDQTVTLTLTAKVINLGRHEWDTDKRLWSTLQVESAQNAEDHIAKGMDSVKPTKAGRH